MFHAARKWLDRKTPAQRTYIEVAAIGAIAPILGIMIHIIALAVGTSHHLLPRVPAPNGKPIGYNVLIGVAAPFTANIYPRRITSLGSQRDSINSKVYLPSGEHAPGGREEIKLTVSNNSAFPITITNISIDKFCHSIDPASETLFFQANGMKPKISQGIEFKLNNPTLMAQSISKSGNLGNPFFDNHTTRLNSYGQHAFYIYVSSSQFCQFEFRLTALTHLGQREIKVLNGGKMFWITGLAHKRGQGCTINLSRYSVVYISNPKDSAHRWRRRDPRSPANRRHCASGSGAVH